MIGASRDGRQEFRFLGGRACLDFTATLGERWGRQAERLRTPQDLASWLVEAGLADQPPAASGQDLAHARTLREAVYQAIKRRGLPGPVVDDCHVARDAVDLLGGPLADRIRECSAGDCALLFLDTSRAGQRRWCSMAACGARAKMAAYRARNLRTAPERDTTRSGAD